MTALLLVCVAAAPLAGCAGFPADKAGGARAPKPVVLTLADPSGDSQEVQGFAGEVARLSGGRLQINVKPAGATGRLLRGRAHRRCPGRQGGSRCGFGGRDQKLVDFIKSHQDKGRVKDIEIEIDGQRVRVGSLTPDQRTRLAAAITQET